MELPQLSFSEALNESTKKIFQFSGRSRRSEYWWTMLVIYVIYTLAPAAGLFGLVLNLFLWAVTIPLQFRRLHDAGHSGWWWGAVALLKVLLVAVILYDLMPIYLFSGTVNSPDLSSSSAVLGYVVKYIAIVILIFLSEILLLIFTIQDSEEWENRYGPSPKYVEDEQNEEQAPEPESVPADE